MSARLAAAAPNRAAADAAVAAAAAGGGAVDAAIAACLVTMVNEPGIVSLGAGAFVTVAVPGQEPVTVDGNVEMPGRDADPSAFGRGVQEVTTAYGGGVTMTIGHGAVATPGALAALGEAHRRFGTAEWQDVVAPAVAVARRGFPLGRASAYYLGLVHEQVFGWHPDSRAAVLARDGSRPLAEGETMRIPHLAESLEHIAAAGPQDLYTGELSRAVVADSRAGGGLIGPRDLAEYRACVRPALTLDVDGWSLATNPPPSIGGPVLAALLLLAQQAPAGADRAGWMVQVQEAVLRHRLAHLDVAPDRSAAAEAMLDGIARQGTGWLRGAPSTVHVSTVDDAGTACAITASAGYGSGVMVAGTGLWMNNCLGEPELNRRGLHAWPPGTRLPSNMAPTVGRRGQEVLALGSPGADRITTALAQVLLAIGQGADLEAAVAAPRLHVDLTAEGEVVVHHEEDLVLPALRASTRVWPRHSMFFGGVTAAVRDAAGGLRAAADPRRGGGTATFG